MLTEKDYCDYDTCVALIEMGYVGISPIVYKGKGKAIERVSRGLWLTPRVAKAHEWTLGIHLYSAQKWLREERGIIVGIINNFTTHEFDYYVSTWEEDRCRGNKYSSYEDALHRGIKKAIKLLKEEK